MVGNYKFVAMQLYFHLCLACIISATAASADINFGENVSDNVINEDAKRVDESATVSVVFRGNTQNIS